MCWYGALDGQGVQAALRHRKLWESPLACPGPSMGFGERSPADGRCLCCSSCQEGP